MSVRSLDPDVQNRARGAWGGQPARRLLLIIGNWRPIPFLCAACKTGTTLVIGASWQRVAGQVVKHFSTL